MLVTKRMRTLGALLSLASALCVCGVAARVQGHTLKAALGNNWSTAIPNWVDCNDVGGVGDFIVARATGFDANLHPICTIDSVGTTVGKECAGAVLHDVQMTDGYSHQVYCTAAGNWGHAASCSKNIVAAASGVTCRTLTFTATSGGTDP